MWVEEIEFFWVETSLFGSEALIARVDRDGIRLDDRIELVGVDAESADDDGSGRLGNLQSSRSAHEREEEIHA